MTPLPRATLTVDLHESDAPGEIRDSAEWLADRGLRASYFVPTRLLERSDYRKAVQAVADAGHLLGTHGHTHSAEEGRCLREAEGRDLDFLDHSTRVFRDTVGSEPRIFRSPAWRGMGAAAATRLAELGYLVDSSATPGRLGLLSSYPRENDWLTAPRTPWLLHGRILEIPTSCFLIPLGAPSVETLRKPGSVLLLSALSLESRWRKGILCLQMHAKDVLLGVEPYGDPRFSWRELAPGSGGWKRFKFWFRETDRDRIAGAFHSLLDRLGGHRILDLLELHEEWEGVRPPAVP